MEDKRGYEWYNNMLSRKTKHIDAIYEIDDDGDVHVHIKDDMNNSIVTILHRDKILEMAKFIALKK